MRERVLKWTAVLTMCVGILLAARPAYAAEQELVPGESASSAARMGYDQEYFSTRRYNEEYFQFTTTGGHGYYRIVFSNISAGDVYGSVVTASGRQVGGRENPYGSNSSRTWLLDLDAYETYYVKIWGGTIGGNYGLNLHKYPDAEGTSKYDAVPMQINWEYTWSKEVNADVDYGVFTAPSTGTYRMTFTNIEGGDLYASLHAFASDRQIGNRLNVYSSNRQKYTDCSLEAGVQYYVKITGNCSDTPKKYGIIVSNQSVTGIQLNQTSLSLEQGDSYELQATVLPSSAANKDITWSASNESVASVSSSGRVRAYRAGTSVITCTANDGSGVSASCIVSVKPGKMSKPYVSACTTSSIRLKWDKLTGARGYTVYQYNSKTRKWKAIKTVKQTTYVVKKLKKATAYKFRVAAYVLNGSSQVYGSRSDSLTAATSPGKTSLSVKQGSSYRSSYYYRYRYITLTAKKIKGASGYQFAYSASKNGSYYTLSTGKRSYRTSARTGQTFYFKVRAYKKAGNTYYYGAYSKPKKVKIRR